jgi:hypothetical protein
MTAGAQVMLPAQHRIRAHQQYQSVQTQPKEDQDGFGVRAAP